MFTKKVNTDFQRPLPETSLDGTGLGIGVFVGSFSQPSSGTYYFCCSSWVDPWTLILSEEGKELVHFPYKTHKTNPSKQKLKRDSSSSLSRTDCQQHQDPGTQGRARPSTCLPGNEVRGSWYCSVHRNSLRDCCQVWYLQMSLYTVWHCSFWYLSSKAYGSIRFISLCWHLQLLRSALHQYPQQFQVHQLLQL